MIFMLTISLLLTASAGYAVTYTLPEKMAKQLQIGSGMKGSFTLHVNGASDAAQMLQAFNDAEIQIRGMISDKDWHYYLYQTDENENQWARTDFYHHGGSSFMKSDLLPDAGILMIPAVEKALDALTQTENGNPPFVSAAWNILHMSEGTRNEVWEPLVQQLKDRMEAWLTPYASEPALRQLENGQSCIELSYVIPMNALKKCILDGLDLIIQNPELMSLAADMMDEEQRAAYLNPYLRYFYSDALDQLNLSFDAALTRTVSLKGEIIHSSIDLPLDEKQTGYSSLSLSSEDDVTSCTLSRGDRKLNIILPSGSLKENGSFSFYIIDTRQDGEASTAQKFTIARTENTWEDEETRSHATYLYTLDVVRDITRIGQDHTESEYAVTPERHGEAAFHFYSKYAQSSPTTLEVNAEWKQEDLEISLNGKFKSASPWIFTPFEINDPHNLMEMKHEELGSLLSSLLLNAGSQIKAAPKETASN